MKINKSNENQVRADGNVMILVGISCFKLCFLKFNSF